jgi:dTMP kinase
MFESKRGKFITFEGCDGSGKSTQARILAEYLQKQGKSVLLTREPGGGKISESIRAIILDGKNVEMTDECEALLYAAARAQHLKEKVEPALAEGKFVVCDRYIHSSYAYQAYARGLGKEFVQKINAFATENYMPDAVVLVNLSAQDAFQRKHGADQNDRLEQAGLCFHQKVYEGFLACANEESERFIVVDGKKSIEEMAKDVVAGLIARGVIE